MISQEGTLISSTNRHNAEKRHLFDYYVTPVNDVELFLRAFDDVVHLNWNNIFILDPSAGGNKRHTDENGTIAIEYPMSYPTAIQQVFGECVIDTYDIREDSSAKHKQDYLTAELSYKPDLIITNPPFNLAMEFIKKSLQDVKDNGYVVMLLRLNFLGSKERFEFFQHNLPKYIFVHHKRISFDYKRGSNGYILFDKYGNPRRGSTDSIEYCHMVWQKGYTAEFANLKVI